MGPLPWTINSEIYPTWARSTSIAIATYVNWSSNLIISMTFLTLADTLGQPPTFGLYAGFSFLALLFFFFLVPETRGRKLEDVEELFKRPYCLNWCRRDSGHSKRRKQWCVIIIIIIVFMLINLLLHKLTSLITLRGWAWLETLCVAICGKFPTKWVTVMHVVGGS